MINAPRDSPGLFEKKEERDQEREKRREERRWRDREREKRFCFSDERNTAFRARGGFPPAPLPPCKEKTIKFLEEKKKSREGKT